MIIAIIVKKKYIYKSIVAVLISIFILNKEKKLGIIEKIYILVKTIIFLDNY